MYSDEYKVIHSTTKEYRDMFRILRYKTPLLIKLVTNKNSDNNADVQSDDNLQRSVRRTRSTINDYVLNNDFDLFITFTFDPKKVDRYNLNACYGRMQLWLANQRRKAREQSLPFRYIVVPEQHKDGAIHFHALVFGLPTKLKKTNVIQNNKRVYNLLGYRYGFTNAQYLDEDKQKANAYLCKYITKDMQLIGGRRRYWCSKNLIKPIKTNNDTGRFVNFLTGDSLEYEDDNIEVYELPKKVYNLFD